MERIEAISQLICAAADSGYCRPEDFATLFDSIELHDAYVINDHDLTHLEKYYTGDKQDLIYRRKGFVKRLMEINNNSDKKSDSTKLNFKPITWGVEDFDNEAEDDFGIPVMITRFNDEGTESCWKVYAITSYDDSWDTKAICLSSDDRRYKPGDEINVEIYKSDTIYLDIKSRLCDALDCAGY